MTEAEYQFKLDTFGRFLELGPQVWTNWDSVKDRCRLSFDSPRGLRSEKRGVLAAIMYRGTTRQKNPLAFGRTIHQPMPEYDLLLTPYLMVDFKGPDLDKILLHELVHLGYGGHGADFRAVCTSVGGVLYGKSVRDPGVHIEQRQANGRYKRVKTFKTEPEARAWFNSMEQALIRGEERERWQLAHPGSSLKEAHAATRWRIIWG